MLLALVHKNSHVHTHMCLSPTPLATTTTSLFLSYKFKQSGSFDPQPLLVIVIPGRYGFTITSGGWSGGILHLCKSRLLEHLY